jgi:hypothetical protein
LLQRGSQQFSHNKHPRGHVAYNYTSLGKMPTSQEGK